MNRRRFLLRSAALAVGGPGAAAGYGLFEAGWLRIDRRTISVPRLPPAFAGVRVALLADLHLGPLNSIEFIRRVISEANALNADLIAVPGDFVERDRECLRPVFAALAELHAPLGVFAVPGNHDNGHADPTASECRRAIRDFGLIDVTNSGIWLERGASRLRVGGVDDLWHGRPRLAPALGDMGPDDTCLLLCHNPDIVEGIRDPRVGLVLSGHTHGGQVYIPGLGAPRVPSRYGSKYLAGLVQGPVAQVFVTRGVGVVVQPYRIAARPEINLLTLIPVAM